MNIETQSGAYVELDRCEVTRKARQLWDESGRPAGRTLEFWLQAEVELLLSRRDRLSGGSSLNGHLWLGALPSRNGHRSKRWGY